MMKKERMVGARLPESVVADLERIEQVEKTDRSTTLRRLLARAIAEWKLDHSAEEYRQGSMTVGRAAEEAGVSVWEMLDYLRLKKVPAQYTSDDLEHDLAVIRDRTRKRSKT